jgi:hypothetical protein
MFGVCGWVNSNVKGAKLKKRLLFGFAQSSQRCKERKVNKE